MKYEGVEGMAVASACYDPQVPSSIKIAEKIALRKNKKMLGGRIKTSIKKNKDAFTNEALNVNEQIQINQVQ